MKFLLRCLFTVQNFWQRINLRKRERVRELPAFVGERDPAVCANLMDRNWGMVNYSTAF